MGSSTENLLDLLLLDSSDESENIIFYSSIWVSNIPNMSSLQFFETFRMSKECYSILLKKLEFNEPKPSSLKAKLYLFIFYICHSSTYRKLREIFGLPKSTIFDIVVEMGEFVSRIAKQEIKFPKPSEFESLKEGFAAISDIHGGILAIDGTHIKITAPNTDNPFSFYNRKGYFSVNFVCLVDYKYRFRGITYGFGSAHDARVYRTSRLKTAIDQIVDPFVYVLGDSAFSGFRNIKATISTINSPISDNDLELLKKQRVIVENTFGIFKNKFRRFDSRIVNGESPKYINIIKATFWIHNFLIENEKHKPNN